MKKTVFLSVITLIMMSCNSNTSNKKVSEVISEEVKEEVTAVGGQKDEHGCLTSAGETWSELRKTCLQIFNEGIRLNPIEIEEGKAIISSFVLFNEDKTKVELFFPTESPTIILDIAKDNIYKNDKYEYNAIEKVIKIDGKEVYKAEK